MVDSSVGKLDIQGESRDERVRISADGEGRDISVNALGIEGFEPPHLDERFVLDLTLVHQQGRDPRE